MKSPAFSSFFEFFFILWLFSYQFKNAFPFFQQPDITVLLTLLLIPWAWGIGRRHMLPLRTFLDPVLLIFLLFSIWCLSSAFWSPSHDYARSKALCYLFYNVPAFFMAYFIVARTKETLTRFLQILCLFTLLIHLYIFYVFWNEGVHIIDILNTNYLRTGQTIGGGFLILFCYSLYTTPSSPSKSPHPALYWISLFLCGTLFYLAINLGGRGPVISMGLAVTILYGGLYFYGKRPYLMKHFLTFCLMLGGVYLLCKFTLAGTTPAFISRMGEAFNLESPDKNITLRLDFYVSALQTFYHHPLIGVGFGGWPVVFGYGDTLWHPHNLFLELLAETGSVGFLGFMALLWKIFKGLSLKETFKNQISCAVLALLIFTFMNAMKSGDLIDNILFFVGLAFVARLKSLPFSSNASLLKLS